MENSSETKGVSTIPTITKFPSNNNNHVLANVGGEKHEISLQILNKYPNSRLGKLSFTPLQTIVQSGICDEYNPDKKEYYFGRFPKIFRLVLSFYYTGKLHISDGICPIAFMEEIKYWGIDEMNLDACCLFKYYQKIQEIKEEEVVLKTKSGTEDFFENTKCGRFRKYIWKMYEQPESSLSGKILKYMSMLLILAFAFLLPVIMSNKIGNLSKETSMRIYWNSGRILQWIKLLFLIEYIARFLLAPNKCKFLKNRYNNVDLLANVMGIVADFFPNNSFLSDLGLLFLVILRIFKIARYSISFQAVLFAFGNSYKEMGKILVLLSMAVLILSRVLYYAEKEENSNFDSLQKAYWWTAVTMNIVGVGKWKLETLRGMLISFCCGICGLLFTGLPIPIIVETFTTYVYNEKRRLKVLNGFQSLQKYKLESKPRAVLILTQMFRPKSSLAKNMETNLCESTFDFAEYWQRVKFLRPQIIIEGYTHEFTWDMLSRTPSTRLGKLGSAISLANLSTLCDDYSMSETTIEFYFHRGSRACASILNFYLTGKFHVLEDNICPNELEAEMKYWMIDESVLESCCYNKYLEKKEQVCLETKEIQNLICQTIEKEIFGDGILDACRKFVWNIVENQNSTIVGSIFGSISCVITFLSVAIMTLKTLPDDKTSFEESDWNSTLNMSDYDEFKMDYELEQHIELKDWNRQKNHTLNIIEPYCIVWFGLEYFLRFFASPHICNFLFNTMNIVDLLIVVSYKFTFLHEESPEWSVYVFLASEICAILRIVRLGRILKFGRHSTAFNALKFTLKNVTAQIGILIFFITLCAILFSTLALLYHVNRFHSSFSVIEDVAETFWWALTTMRTVATDGDLHTVTITGKFIGFVCGLFGLIFLVLPIPIIVNNYAEFYKNREVKRKKNT